MAATGPFQVVEVDDDVPNLLGQIRWNISTSLWITEAKTHSKSGTRGQGR